MKKPKLTTISGDSLAFMGIVIIFAVLLVQSTITLFTGLKSDGLVQIDTVFRTSISSIFGYLMSVMSSDKRADKTPPPTQKPPTIGFASVPPPQSPPTPPSPPAPPPATATAEKQGSPHNKPQKSQTAHSQSDETLPSDKKLTSNIRIIVLIVACIFCLCVMMVVRNFSELIAINSSTTVTISLFRDIISGSVGALIGHSRKVS